MTEDIYLHKVLKPKKKRLGRGYGSGKGGHTVGKGQKGQKTRKRLGILFEGVKVKKSLIKRLPFLRGKGKFTKAEDAKPLPLDVSILNEFAQGAEINLKALIEKGVVDKKIALKRGVKILGSARLEKKLTVTLPVSKSSSESIIKAGGKVISR